MDITLIVSGNLCNGYDAVRPIILEARMEMEKHHDIWVVTDDHFQRYGAHREFRLAVADCLADMAKYYESVLANTDGKDADQDMADEFARYLRKRDDYLTFNPKTSIQASELD